MMPLGPELEAECWAFALDIYAKPGIADGCLKLQNQAGVDVVLLLTIVFAAVRLRILPTPAEIEQLDEACRPWRDEVVRPLRSIRSRLKTGPLPAPSSETELFRTEIKAAELEAERLHNNLLVGALPARRGRQAVAAEQLRSVVGSVVTLFLGKRSDGLSADLLRSIDEIVEAAMQQAR
jgi:uncharacterized protein (TIGR02444 family)